MTSTLSTTFRSSKSGIAAQDLIRLTDSIFKNGMLRKKGKRLNFGKWPHRFVVLTYDSVYVYDNESSKTPNLKFSLLGYNRVTRCAVKGHEWCFSIMPASSNGSVKEKTFACFSDAERKQWMQAIKTQIYTANNIPQPVMTILDKIKAMTTGFTDEDDYSDIEHVVYETSNGTTVDEDSDDDEDSDSSLDSDSEVTAPVYKKTTRSKSLPHNSLFASDTKNSLKFSTSRKSSDDSCEPKLSEYETFNDLLHSTNEPQKTRRLPSDPQPKVPLELSIKHKRAAPCPNSDTDQTPPPRYSEVYKEEQESSVEHDYVNLSSIIKDDYETLLPPSTPSLESMSTMTDTYLDRNGLIALLRAKNVYGTYLIRKSRTDNHKVIAFLCQNGQVREYKIYGTPDNSTLDRKRYFMSIEELLQNYTSVEPFPGTNDFLKRGFHEVKGDVET